MINKKEENVLVTNIFPFLFYFHSPLLHLFFLLSVCETFLAFSQMTISEIESNTANFLFHFLPHV